MLSRFVVTGLMAGSMFIMGCQQQKIGSEPTPAAQPKPAGPAATPPPNQVPPPRGPGPGAGAPPPVINRPPPGGPGPGFGPGPGPGAGGAPPPPGYGPGGAPPPPPPGYGPGPGPGAGGAPPPPGYGPGGGAPPPPPPTGAGPGPGYGNGPGPGTVYPTPGPGPGTVYPTPGPGPGPGYGNGPGPGSTPVTPTYPPTTTYPPTPPPNTPPSGYPPTQVNPPTQQPLPPNLQPAPTVPAVNLPPQNYPPQPQCIGANCGNQQIIPPPPPQPVAPAPAPMPPPQGPIVGPPSQKPMGPPAPMQPVQPNPPPVTVNPPQQPPAPLNPAPPSGPGVTLPAEPVVQQPPAPKPECVALPVDAELDTTKLDVLFVLDTSASMRDGQRSGMQGELGMIAKSMATFARNLDPKTDFRIGMMLGHGPENAKHPGYKHGTLFQTSASDPAVIDFAKELKACGSGKNARECAINRVVQALEKKMHSIPTDHSDAQGEALMLSLYDMATSEDLRRGIMKQGLFRKDALLSIIPISDEQDVCYADVDESTGRYDANVCQQLADESEEAFHKRCTPAQVKLKDAKGKLTGRTGADPHELNFYRSFCKNAVDKTSPLTPEAVKDALTNMKVGEVSQLAITPIIYMDNSMPVHDQDENEMGHGYLELGRLAGGIFGDLNVARAAKGQANFEPVLAAFGKFVTTKMTIRTPFECGSDVNPLAVNLDTIDVHIIDQDGKDLQLFEPQCTGANCAGHALGVVNTDGNGKPTHMSVKVDDVTLSNALKAHNFKKGKVQIKFKTRPDIDVNTGLQKSNLGIRGRAAHKKKKAAAAQPAKSEQHAELLDSMPTDI